MIVEKTINSGTTSGMPSLVSNTETLKHRNPGSADRTPYLSLTPELRGPLKLQLAGASGLQRMTLAQIVKPETEFSLILVYFI